MPPSTNDEILRPRKGTWALVLLIGAAFVSIGLLMVRDPASSRERFWAYGGIVFFGLCAAVALIQFIPGSSFLRISSDGALTIYPIGLDKAGHLWRTAPDAAPHAPWIEPVPPLRPKLIEPPITL